MDKELFELCKEVYKRTDWLQKELHQAYYRRGHYFSNEEERQPGEPELHEYEGKYVDFPVEFLAPLYTSDYLLEQLPTKKGYEWLVLEKRGDHYSASYGMAGGGYEPDNFWDWQPADTALKALLKLTIALHETGELA